MMERLAAQDFEDEDVDMSPVGGRNTVVSLFPVLLP